jgi:pimeloyl-ACP methyl ester carboxylesterase
MPQADESGLAPVNDIKIYYAIFNKKGKDPVILLHGGLTSSDYWGFEVPLLSATHEVIVVDSRGHGRSSMSDQPFSYNLMSSDVLQLMDYLRINKASIVGWSDGGIIGLILAIHSPDRVNKLFTFGTNYNLSGYKDEPSDTTTAAHFMAQAQANYRKLSPTPDSFISFRKALGKMYSVEPDLKPEDIKTIKAPTIIACGQYDQFIKPEHFAELAHLIPNAKLVVLPNVSHGGALQDPAAFHKAVADLLDATQ